jgi:regulator of nonsense transcripts 2
LALIEQDLPECNRRDKIDELAERFCVNHGTSKTGRKRIQKAIVQVRRQDLLPFFSRLTAIFDRVYPEIASQVVTEIEQQFHGLARWKKQQNLEHRMRNARYLGELTKFRVAPPIVALRCLKRCILDFSGYNIDVACCLLEACGRYLHRMKHTNTKIVEIMDSINRLRKVKFLDDRYNALIDSAIFMVVPPPVTQKERKVLDPMEAYLLDLLVVRLTPKDEKVALAKKQIGRLPWSDPSKNCGYLVAKYILKACRKGRYNAVSAVVGLMLSLKKDKPEVYIRVLDTLIEELQYFLEVPNPRDHQRALSYARLLGEMYNRGLVGFTLIIVQLYNIVNYGHAIPPALREASYKHEMVNDDPTSSKPLSSKLLKAPSGVSRTIKEDEEFEEKSVSDESLHESSHSKPVAVSSFSKFDPRVPSSLDPPTSVFRIKLVCTILDSCVPSITNQNKASLNQFLASFQRYIFTKSSIPADIEFSILDSFDLIDSRLRSVHMDVNSRKIPEGYGILRYKTWHDAHNATISYEEKDAIAAKRFENSNMTISGESANLDEEILLNEEVASSSDSDDDGDDSVADQQSQESNVDVLDDEQMDEASMDQQSDDDNEGSDDEDINSNEDEDEIDEEALQRSREQKLEEEMFDQELRRITLEAIEKGKVAARTGFGGKVSDAMPSASQFIKKKSSDLSGDSKDNFAAALTGGGGVQFNFLKKGHKGRVEAKSLVVPSDSNIAKVLSKQDHEAIREKNILKARVLQYEVENSELFPALSPNVGPKTKERHRPLLMEDIDSTFK